MTRITIDPITRLEGHGKIDIFLDDQGDVADCYFIVPELRGFEAFCVGRPVEEMPRITSRICGVCSEAHHLAAAKACDDVYHVEIPPAAKKLRELLYSAFYTGDHATHFYILGGPDFVMGPEAPPAERNILGMIHKLGVDVGKTVIGARAAAHDIVKTLGGKTIHMVTSIAGGVTKGLTEEEREGVVAKAEQLIEFGKFTIEILNDVVLGNPAYLDLILSDTYTHRFHSMGTVDANNHVNFYDGMVRVVDVDGAEIAKYHPRDYLDHVSEHVETWSYLKFPFLKQKGWHGFVDGADSGLYRATPLSRLNAADGMATPLAQSEYERYFETLTGDRSGRTPVHQTLATHWARVVELVYAAERTLQLATDDEITSDEIRVVPTAIPTEGVGGVEAPRGTLTHHYITDERGILQKVNLIVGTTNNHGPISMSIKKAAQGIIKRGVEVTEGALNKIEMAFRAYDPCFACATHSLPGAMPLIVRVRAPDGTILAEAGR
ncbi:MAG: F420-nonreducing hydrogenase [Actinobacteria bacterium RBG_16_68_21]|nr:MAG: F420-nonreducing hydrogenase [Actinobacteria bacterium RBG_16_68_21]